MRCDCEHTIFNEMLMYAYESMVVKRSYEILALHAFAIRTRSVNRLRILCAV